jgi:hypothetical protein
LQDVHEELQGGELHRHRWLSGGSQGPLMDLEGPAPYGKKEVLVS